MKYYFRNKNYLLMTVCLLIFFKGVAQESEKVNDNSIDNPTKARPTLTVNIAKPVLIGVDNTVEANGNIEAREVAAVNSQVSGLSLNKILVDVGDIVKKDQLLAEYDLTSVVIAIAQAEANLKQAKLSAQQATLNANRARKLRKSRAISGIENDNYLFQEKKAKAGVEVAQSVYQNQKLRASYAQVTAKVGGVIIDKKAILGSIGNPGTPLFSIITNGELEWQANVPSDALGKIVKNMPVSITINNSGELLGIQGQVRNIDPIIDSKTLMGKVYVSMAKHHLLRQGLFVRGQFKLGNGELLSVPSTSIIRRDGYSYVFVVDDNDKILRKKVQLGTSTNNRYLKTVSIAKGLSTEDRVVTSGVGFLKSGDLVRVVDDK